MLNKGKVIRLMKKKLTLSEGSNKFITMQSGGNTSSVDSLSIYPLSILTTSKKTVSIATLV